MEYKVEHSSLAERDLDTVFEHLASRLKAYNSARNMLDDYKSKLAGLQYNPHLHALLKIKALSGMDYRWFNFGSCYAVYNVDEKKHTVYIVRVFIRNKTMKAIFNQADQDGDSTI